MTMRPNGNREHDMAIYVAQYTKLTTDELRIMLHSGTSRRLGNTPWQREAIRRVLKARGEEA